MNAVSRQPRLANAVALHKEPESFTDFAFAELAAAPLVEPGICFRPECSAAFAPSREWQIYCSSTCARAGVAEMRKWGHKLALAMLTWRIGKYEQTDKAVQARTRAARRYVTAVQSAWLADRARRAERAGM